MAASKRPALLAAALLVLLALSSCGGQVAAQKDSGDGADGFLIRLKRDVTPQQIKDDAPDHFDLLAGAIKDKLVNLGLSLLRAVGTQGYMLAQLSNDFPLSPSTVKRALEALGFDVTQNARVNITAVPGDTLWSSIAPAMTSIAADQAWDVTTGDTAIKVCVIDTGVAFQHPDLAANIPDQMVYNAITNSMATPDNDDNGGHGTHVTGTIAGVGNNAEGVTGVNWRANVIVCKFLDGENGGLTSDAIECIRWCRDQGARIMSNSWGSSGPSEQALVDEITVSENAGMLFVAAAGNENQDIDATPSSPADVNSPNVVVVGALLDDSTRADFSNYGVRSVDLYAPGVDITSTWPTGTGYNTISGTSMATPHVSGAAALLWGYKPSATYTEIKNALLASVDSVPGAADSVTGGRLNVKRALDTLVGTTTPPDNGTPNAPESPSAPDSPPSPGPDGCQDASTSCFEWSLSGYCEPGYTWNGVPVSAICPVSCDSCGACEDLYQDCPTWKDQGYCDPSYTVDGDSVPDVACRATCGTCGASAQALPESVTLDISGVWSTGDGLLDKLLPVYVKFDAETSRGYALWLKSPPQALTIRSVGGNKFTMTDVFGATYAVKAEADSGVRATKLVVGKGDKAKTWTRHALDKGLPFKYFFNPGDTLESVAQQFNVTVDDLLKANPFLNIANLVLDGKGIVLPGANLNPADVFDFSTKDSLIGDRSVVDVISPPMPDPSPMPAAAPVSKDRDSAAPGAAAASLALMLTAVAGAFALLW